MKNTKACNQQKFIDLGVLLPVYPASNEPPYYKVNRCSPFWIDYWMCDKPWEVDALVWKAMGLELYAKYCLAEPCAACDSCCEPCPQCSPCDSCCPDSPPCDSCCPDCECEEETPQPVCGDGNCDPAEDCATCPQDCGPCDQGCLTDPCAGLVLPDTDDPIANAEFMLEVLERISQNCHYNVGGGSSGEWVFPRGNNYSSPEGPIESTATGLRIYRMKSNGGYSGVGTVNLGECGPLDCVQHCGDMYREAATKIANPAWSGTGFKSALEWAMENGQAPVFFSKPSGNDDCC